MAFFAAIIIAAYILVAFFAYYRLMPVFRSTMVDYSLEQGKVQKELLHGLDVPYVLLDLDGRVHRLIAKKSGEGLAKGIISASLLFCIGTFSIVGPVMSALNGDNTFLFTNSTLDLVTSMVFATTYGIGIIITAPILFCWQGMFYLIAKLAGGTAIMQGTLVNELAIVGGVLIISSGLSILEIKDCKTLNYLPALLVPVLWFLLKGLFGI